jgi:hypothetical protein
VLPICDPTLARCTITHTSQMGGGFHTSSGP